MTLDDALVDVGISFLQVEFSIKLLSYCEFDRIRPAEFDTHQVVLLEQENLAFPTGRFSTQEDIVRAAMVAVSLALAGSALTLDKAWDIAGIRPRPPFCRRHGQAAHARPHGTMRLRTRRGGSEVGGARGLPPGARTRTDERAPEARFARASWPEFRLCPARGPRPMV